MCSVYAQVGVRSVTFDQCTLYHDMEHTSVNWTSCKLEQGSRWINIYVYDKEGSHNKASQVHSPPSLSPWLCFRRVLKNLTPLRLLLLAVVLTLDSTVIEHNNRYCNTIFTLKQWRSSYVTRQSICPPKPNLMTFMDHGRERNAISLSITRSLARSLYYARVHWFRATTS